MQAMHSLCVEPSSRDPRSDTLRRKGSFITSFNGRITSTVYTQIYSRIGSGPASSKVHQFRKIDYRGSLVLCLTRRLVGETNLDRYMCMQPR